jgi:hypothetical protein
MERYTLVGANVDTLIINVKGALVSDLDADLDRLKQASQEADADVPTPWTFAGETLFIKAHGSGRQWRYILHCPSLHLDVGRGRLNGIIAKARLSSAFLWERGADGALALLAVFLVGYFGDDISLQVSEAHLCADVAGWDVSLDDAPRFLTRAHKRSSHLDVPDSAEDETCGADEAPPLEVNLDGRRCTGFVFSRGAAHSCTLYDKTKEITVSRKDWMRVVWRCHGWDGTGRVLRVEFRYKRECLHEMGVEDAFAFLDQLPGLWAYSTRCWLRHTTPTADVNRGRWPVSPPWRVVQEAAFYGGGVPAVREHKRVGDLTLICQMLAGCSTTAAAYLANELPDRDTGADFLTWFYDWLMAYLDHKGETFTGQRDSKRLRLGVVSEEGLPAA